MVIWWNSSSINFSNGEEEIEKNEAMDKVEDSNHSWRQTRDTTRTTEGMQFDRGYLSPYFITDAEKMICEFLHPLFF